MEPRPSSAPGLEALAFVALYAQLAAVFWVVPRWSLAHFREPVYLAVAAGIATTLWITALRVRGLVGSSYERVALVLFLAGMPLIYLWSWLRSPEPGWLGLELVGLAVFVGLAGLGLVRSAWFLAVGIAAHGLGWDLWHYGRTPFVPDWYTVSCLITDVGMGFYAAVQVRRFRTR
jgi:hypothetical protein